MTSKQPVNSELGPVVVIDRLRKIRCEDQIWTCEFISKRYVQPSPEKTSRRDGNIYVPDGQREWAWKGKKAEKMSKLIDSILHGYPIPSCIVNQIDENQIRYYDVYDGRHRFETIWRFINNMLPFKGKLFKDITETEQEAFKNRRIQIMIVDNATSDQLADIFIRLNSGQPLTDSDMFWAYRASPLVSATIELVSKNTRLSKVLGDLDLSTRSDLANWVAHVAGLSTGNAGNMTTSFIRISDKHANLLNTPVEKDAVRRGLDALSSLYERANTESKTTDKHEMRSMKKIGKIGAFFLAEWMKAAPKDRDMVLEKWVQIILGLRSTDEKTRRHWTRALQVPGAQNLNEDKIAKVLKNIEEALEELPNDSEDDELADYDSEDSNE